MNIDQTIRYAEILRDEALVNFDEVVSKSPPDRFGTKGADIHRNHIKQVYDGLVTNIKQSND